MDHSRGVFEQLRRLSNRIQRQNPVDWGKIVKVREALLHFHATHRRRRLLVDALCRFDPDGANSAVTARIVELLTQCVEGGNPSQLSRLGTMYANGERVAQDEERALSYFRQGWALPHWSDRCTVGFSYADFLVKVGEVQAALNVYKTIATMDPSVTMDPGTATDRTAFDVVMACTHISRLCAETAGGSRGASSRNLEDPGVRTVDGPRTARVFLDHWMPVLADKEELVGDDSGGPELVHLFLVYGDMLEKGKGGPVNLQEADLYYSWSYENGTERAIAPLRRVRIALGYDFEHLPESAVHSENVHEVESNDSGSIILYD